MELGVVQGALDEHFGKLHPKQRQAMALVVFAVLLTRTLTLSAMGREAAAELGRSPCHVIKQIDRTLSSPTVGVWTLWQLWAAWLLADTQGVVIAIDWTSLQCDQMRVLWAGLCTRDGRTIPLLAFAIHARHLKRRQTQIEARMIARLREMIPHGVPTVVLADRGFDGYAFRAWVTANGLHFVVRLRGNLKVTSEGRTGRARSFCPRRGAPALRWRDARITAAGHGGAHLVTAWAATSTDPWILATDLEIDAAQVCALYAMRFLIEEMLRDLKNVRLGLGLEPLAIDDPDRCEKLLFAVSVAYTFQRRVGQLAQERGLARRFSTRKGRGTKHSTFSLGRFHAKASPALFIEALQSANDLGFITPP
jgi:hypothetical protein